MGVEFDGTDDFMDFNNPSSSLLSNTGDWTLSIWVNTPVVGIGHIFTQYLQNVNNGRVLLRFESTNTINLFLGNVSGFASVSIITNQTLSIDIWYNITVQRSSNTYNIFINGFLDKSFTDTGTRSLLQTGNLIGARTASASTYNASLTEFFTGRISEFAIWNIALTTDEIEIIGNSYIKQMPLQVQSSNLVTYVPMDDSNDGTSGDGQSYVDLSGNNNNPTGNDGANNTGLTNKAEEVLSYQPNIIVPGIKSFIPYPIFKGLNGGIPANTQGGIAA